MAKILILLFLIVIVGGYSLNKKLINSNKQDNSISFQGKIESVDSSIIKFVNKDFKLYSIETINNGRAFYYSPDAISYDVKYKLIINKYDEWLGTKALADRIVEEGKKNGSRLYLPFTANNAYYITKSEIIPTKGAIIYIIKVFENNNRVYSLIYGEIISEENKDLVDSKIDKWVLDNLEIYSNALEKIDVSIPDQLDNNNEIKNIYYADIVTSDIFNLNKFIGKKIKWEGKIASNYSQIDGIKFCVVDDKHINPNSHTDCDWFWAIPRELATNENPTLKNGWNGNWNEFVFKKYSDIDYNKINSDRDAFLITGILKYIDFGVDYNNKPIPNIEVIKIEQKYRKILKE